MTDVSASAPNHSRSLLDDGRFNKKNMKELRKQESMPESLPEPQNSRSSVISQPNELLEMIEKCSSNPSLSPD